jgi:hypothetical protein
MNAFVQLSEYLRSVVMFTMASPSLSDRFAFPRGCCDFGNALVVVVLAALEIDYYV